MASDAKILQLIARVALFTVESTENLAYQTVMRSCYKPGKILLNARWERTSPKGRRIWRARLSQRGTKCREERETLSLNYMLVTAIRPQSLPSAVFRSTG